MIGLVMQDWEAQSCFITTIFTIDVGLGKRLGCFPRFSCFSSDPSGRVVFVFILSIAIVSLF